MTDAAVEDEGGLRADARRNRDRVAAAAREVFAESGVDAPMMEIAKRAGVGRATLYRRFPTLEDLLGFVFEDRMHSCGRSIRAALREPDAWLGFELHLRHLMALQREDRAFTAVLLHEFPEASPVETERREAAAGLRALIRRAQDAGAMRRDITQDDVVAALYANEGVISHAAESELASTRLEQLLLRAFHV